MLVTIAIIFAGLGLFLSGNRMISLSMKQIASRQLRQLFTKWARLKVWGFLGGVFSGAIFQSGSNAALIMSSFVAGGMMDIKTALPIIAAANIGTAVLVFLVAGDIKLVVVYLLAITSIVYGFNRNDKWEQSLTALLGIGLLLFGFQTLQSGVKPLADFSGFQSIFYDQTYYYLLPFIIGIVLRLITLSSSAVTMIVITMSAQQILVIDQQMAIIYGGSVGAALATYLFAANLKGVARQISSFQIVFELSGASILSILLIIEAYTQLPMVKSWVTGFVPSIEKQVAYIYLLTRVVPTVLTYLLLDFYVTFLQRISPPTIDEDLAKPQYIFEQALNDSETAMDLLEKEQLRVVRHMAECFEHPTHLAGRNYKNIRSALKSLHNEIALFISALFSQSQSTESVERLVNIQNRQSIIVSLEEELFRMADIMETSHKMSENLASLINSIKEGLLTILLTAIDGAESRDGEEVKFVLTITGDRDGFLERLRRNYLFGERELPQDERAALVDVTDQYKHIVWLIRKWTELMSIQEK